MDGYSISQVAERTGFPASTLRFYEQSGLIDPARTPAGYRRYDDHQVEQLTFVGRAKGFGLSLDEIAELLSLLDEDQCAPVQDRLRDLVDHKITDAQHRIGELVGFTAELQRVSATLARPASEGPCDDACGCTTENPDRRPTDTATFVALTDGPSVPGRPIACSLPPEQTHGRMAAWQAALAPQTNREQIDGGVRVSCPIGVDVATLATLCAAERRRVR